MILAWASPFNSDDYIQILQHNRNSYSCVCEHQIW